MKKRISLTLLNKQMLKIDHVQILDLDLVVGQGPEPKAGQGQDPIHQDQNRDPGAEVGPAHILGLGLRVEPLKGLENRSLDLDQTAAVSKVEADQSLAHDHPLAPEDQGRGQVQLQVVRLGRVLHLQLNPAQDQNELENIRCCLNMFVERNLIGMTE